MTLEEAEDALHQAEEAMLAYAVASMLRGSYLRRVEYLAGKDLEEQTVAMLDERAHYTREARAQERVMSDALRKAQQLNELATTALEALDDE